MPCQFKVCIHIKLFDWFLVLFYRDKEGQGALMTPQPHNSTLKTIIQGIIGSSCNGLVYCPWFHFVCRYYVALAEIFKLTITGV